MSHAPMNQITLIRDLLRNGFKDRRAEVGVSFIAHSEVLELLLLEPHRFTVFGENFHAMFRVMTRCKRNSGGALRDDILFLETRFLNLPLRPGSLDAVILLGGLPRFASDPAASLVAVRALLKPGGLMIWPQASNKGFFGWAAKLRHAEKKGFFGAPDRTLLCQSAMEAGFMEIGQTPLKTRAVPWVVTFGRAANRPWEVIPTHR
jgi:hypothetical protein